MTEEFLSNWIWTNEWTCEDRQAPRIVYFRKEFGYADKIKISANCRYKLYINGQFVQEGPQKGCAVTHRFSSRRAKAQSLRFSTPSATVFRLSAARA